MEVYRLNQVMVVLGHGDVVEVWAPEFD